MTKQKGKFVPYKINDEVRKRIKSFSEMLVNMKEDYGPDSKQTKTINIILNDLDAFDRNFIIAYSLVIVNSFLIKIIIFLYVLTVLYCIAVGTGGLDCP